MPALPFSCITIPLPPTPPKINIPAFGSLQQGWETLGGIPSASDLIAKLLDKAALALAPVRQILEIIEALSAVYQCLSKIPDAILSLDPAEIFKCLENVHKSFARVLARIPPLSYIQMGMDIASLCMDIIEACLELLQAIDAFITGYVNIAATALAAGDTELSGMLTCGMSEALPPILQLADAMAFIKMGMGCLLDPFIRLVPGGGALQPMKTMIDQVDEYVKKVRTQIEGQGGAQTPPLPSFPGFSPPVVVQPAIVPFPPLGALVFSMGVMYDQQVLVYNILAKVLGKPAKPALGPLPSFTNF